MSSFQTNEAQPIADLESIPMVRQLLVVKKYSSNTEKQQSQRNGYQIKFGMTIGVINA